LSSLKKLYVGANYPDILNGIRWQVKHGRVTRIAVLFIRAYMQLGESLHWQ